jgi:hypothetical protein
MRVKSLNKGFTRIAVLALVLAGASLSTTATAVEKGYYKWTDSGGRPQHSDRPPPAGVDYDFVSTDSGLTRRVTKEKPSAPKAVTTPAPKKSADDTRDNDPVAIEKNPALCDHARANLDTLNSKARVRIRDDDGAIRYLTPDEKDIQRQKAQDLIAVHCS